jgi:uncharacterized protein (TIGR02266 family)
MAERRTHFRGKPRPGRRVEVEYQTDTGPLLRAFTRNIGVGGAFIVTDRPEKPGTGIKISLRVPTSDQTIRVRAEVRWQSAGAGDEPAGMGVKFFGLEVEELLQLNEYFASLTGRDEAVG